MILVGPTTEVVTFDPEDAAEEAVGLVVLVVELVVDAGKESVIVTWRYPYEERKAAFRAVANAIPVTWPLHAPATLGVRVHSMSLNPISTTKHFPTSIIK